MNYELAKRLKDAGFPQNAFHNALYPLGYVLRGTKAGQKQSEKDRAYPPTLSEMMVECGDNLRVLEHFVAHKGKDEEWFAYGIEEKNVTQTNIGRTGSTPEIAMARLWLALHGKDS